MGKRFKKPRIILRVDPNGARQPAIEPAELLLMIETLSRWVLLDTRNKTYLSKELFIVAARILELKALRTHWILRHTWPARAFAAGIDPKTIRVIDERRFKWFWYQLGQTGKFSIKWQKELINSGREPPEMLPLLITKPYMPDKIKAERQQAKAVKQSSDNYMKEEIIDHFFV